MTLNKQLLCVSLLLFSLPWAGCQYLRELDAALRDSQQHSLQATAQVVATALAQKPQMLDPHGVLDTETVQSQPGIYCYPLNAPVRADGYFDEWVDDSTGEPGDYPRIPWSEYRSDDGANRLHYRCGVYQQDLALAFMIRDRDVIYNDPTQSLADNGDRLILVTGKQSYIFTAVAPGNITTRYFADPHTTYRESLIDAAWIDNENGYQIEINMPLKLAEQRLSFAVINQTADKTVRYGPYQKQTPPPRFVFQAPIVGATLATFEQAGMRLSLLNPQGLLIASAGNPEPEKKTSAHWLLQKIYRAILATEQLDAGSGQDSSRPDSLYTNAQNPAIENTRQPANAIDFSAREEFSTARTGSISSRWYRDPNRSNHQLLATATPVLDHGQVIAVLLAEQSSEQTAALTDQAFSQLFGLSLAVIVASALALLMYASWLSWRIRKLSRATQLALDEQGKFSHHFPTSTASDEIGALTRNYAELMKRIAEYTEYLQTLSRKLSHELRTPLAIIHSSLDNLSSRSLDPASQTYQQRAKDGATRLGNILTALSEARRVEESIDQAEPETTNIRELIQQVTQAYNDIYDQHCIEFSCVDSDENPVLITAVPDLLVQMLDKLVDNAASFCPPSGSIVIALETSASAVTISVSNDGPLLPDTMRKQLFDNMVSLRESSDDSTHLGLGLYIVSLIVNYHRGSARAENRADQSGVTFSICLPRNNS